MKLCLKIIRGLFEGDAYQGTQRVEEEMVGLDQAAGLALDLRQLALLPHKKM